MVHFLYTGNQKKIARVNFTYRGSIIEVNFLVLFLTYVQSWAIYSI